MEFVETPDVAQVNVRGVIDQQRVQNTLYFQKDSGGIVLADITALAAGIEAWWTVNARPLLSVEYGYREVYAVDQTSIDGPTSTASSSSGWQGTRPFSTQMPNNATIAVSFRTAKRGRTYRGRNYWPLLSRGDVSGNQVLQAYVNLVVLAYDLLLPFGGATPAGWTWVVVSRTFMNAPRTYGIKTPVEDVLITDRTIDSQRRRLPGRGI